MATSVSEDDAPPGVASPWDFGPPTGRGMRALRAISSGDVLYRLPVSELVTPRRCRGLLQRWSSATLEGSSQESASRRFLALEEVCPRLSAQVLSDQGEVLDACRAAGIDPENDAAREKLLDTLVWVVSVDASDSTVEVQRLHDLDGPTTWFAVNALARPTLESAVAAISDVEAMAATLCALASRLEAGGRIEDLGDRDFCKTLEAYLEEAPKEPHLPAVWSDVELAAFDGSLHAPSARAQRARCLEARGFVRGLLVGAKPSLDTGISEERVAAEPFWGSEERFLWAWGVVMSRRHSAGCFSASYAREEGETFLARGLGMFNHDPSLPCGRTMRLSDNGQYVEFISLADFEEGKEIFISYGDHGNSDLLLYYGFATAGNPHDCVELVLTLDSLGTSEARAAVHNPRAQLLLDCLACRPQMPPGFAESAKASERCKMSEASGTECPEVKVALSMFDPLPGALLGLSRVERLSEADIAALQVGLGHEGLSKRLRAGLSLDPGAGHDPDLRCTALRCELRAAGALRKTFFALLRGYPAGPVGAAASSTSAVTKARLACGALLCASEQEILTAGARKAEELLSVTISSSLEAARRLFDDAKRGAGSVATYLESRRPAVDAADSQVVALFEELTTLPLGPEPARTSAVWSQTCAAFFLLLHGLESHPLTGALVRDVPEFWSLGGGAETAPKAAEPHFLVGQLARVQGLTDAAHLNGRVGLLIEWNPRAERWRVDLGGDDIKALRPGSLQRLEVAAASAAVARRCWASWGPLQTPNSGTADEYLALYRSKTGMWGRYLLAQFLVSGAVRLSAMNDMAMESMDLRQRHAWSIPSPEALRLLAKEGPLVEACAGRSLWARLLRQQRATVRDFEAAEGGPEMLAALAETYRALLLIWPDRGGKGSFGLGCCRAWLLEGKGARLICVGEWAGTNTFGAVGVGVNGGADDTVRALHGQSFSAECQAFVEEHCRLLRTLPLPNWPLVLDGVRIYERRAPA